MVYDLEQDCLSREAQQQFQELWANNGDAISRQYTGTDALKVRTTIITIIITMVSNQPKNCKSASLL